MSDFLGRDVGRAAAHRLCAVIFLGAGFVLFILANLIAWTAHFMEMIPRAFDGGQIGDIILLIAGGIIPLIGMIHGWYIILA